MKGLLATAGLLLLAGCTTMDDGPPPPPPAYLAGLQLAAAQDTATAGSNIALTLTNASGQAIGYDLCLGALERRVGDFWVPALSDYKPCPETYATLEPGGQASGMAPLDPALESDQYRYVTKVTDRTGFPVPGLVRSNPFRVVAIASPD